MMDIAYAAATIAFLIANSLFFYYKGYRRAQKDDQLVAKFVGKLDTMIDNAFARGAFFALENLESFEMIDTEMEQEGTERTVIPHIIERHYATVNKENNDIVLSFEFLYNPHSNTYKILSEDEET